MKTSTRLTVNTAFSVSQKMLSSLQLLQMDCLSLEKHIAEQLLENPVLEFPSLAQKRPAGTDWESLQASHGSDYETLDFFLLDQLDRMSLTPGVKGLCRTLVRTLDENGYLQVDLVPEGCLQNPAYPQALEVLQSLDPPGVGARGLSECLALQLRRTEPENALVLRLAEHHLEDISRRNLAKLQKATGASKDDLNEAISQIIRLEPKPGAAFAKQSRASYIHPDFLITLQDGQILITPEEHAFPVLVISSHYDSLLLTSQDPEVRRYLKERIAAAKQLISGLENRKNTTLRCMEAIVQLQQGFFQNPSRQLSPLTLETVAGMVGLHISTVSRAIHEKYLEFDGKTYPLKYFFVRGIQDAHTQVSASQIRELIRQIIRNEDPNAPMSDQQIVEILNQGGGGVSRRTVAKYRQQMGILPSKQRRKI